MRAGPASEPHTTQGFLAALDNSRREHPEIQNGMAMDPSKYLGDVETDIITPETWDLLATPVKYGHSKSAYTSLRELSLQNCEIGSPFVYDVLANMPVLQTVTFIDCTLWNRGTANVLKKYFTRTGNTTGTDPLQGTWTRVR
jgi:hypothetical protein